MRQITHVAATLRRWGRVDPASPTMAPVRAIHRGSAVIVVGLVVAAGCNRDGTATTSIPEAALDRVATSVAADPIATASASHSVPPAPATTAPAPDATTTLTAALDTLATGYHFVTTVTVGGQITVVAEGDHVAGATQMTVTSAGGASTQYLVTPDAAWAQTDGEWRQLDRSQGITDPVSQLRSPLSVELVGTAEAATITARYHAAALGVRGAGERAVEFQLANGLITRLSYASTAAVTDADGATSEQRTEVTAVITPIAPGTEITLPIAGA